MRAVSHLAALFATALCLAASSAPSMADLADETVCRPESGSTYLVIDTTTPFTAEDTDALTEGTDRIVSRLRIGEHLRVVKLTDSIATMKLVFDGCRPGCEDGAVLCAQLRERSRINDFIRHLGAALRAVVPTRELRRSEIGATLTYAIRWPADETSPRSVYIFSDMLERTSLINLSEIARNVRRERTSPDMVIERTMKLLETGGFHPDLKNTTVTVFGFGREDTRHDGLDGRDTEFVRRFWTAVFMKAGAKSADFLGYLP